MSEQNRIPQHVAIIMDGNGRWAELRGKERYEGHVAGVEPVRASLRAAARWGVKYLTLYAFSTENWGRPAQEVDALMELFCKSVVNETPELIRQGVEIRMIGDRTRFSEKVQRYLAEAEQRTAGGKTLTLILALNYSSRSEITRAVRQIAARAASGELAPEEISEGTISAALDTAPYPNHYNQKSIPEMEPVHALPGYIPDDHPFYFYHMPDPILHGTLSYEIETIYLYTSKRLRLSESLFFSCCTFLYFLELFS